MSDQPQLIPKSMYEYVKGRGVDMGWYERGKRALNAAVPLEDDACSDSSIYLMDVEGLVWTLKIRQTVTDRDGDQVLSFHAEPYKQVRSMEKKLAAPVYVCMHTKAAYSDLNAAMTHALCPEPTS